MYDECVCQNLLLNFFEKLEIFDDHLTAELKLNKTIDILF